ncbi:hypothetical protein ABD91_21145 [Lysinibacillus sphaericus]|uniref:Bax inhibitor-1/YccA family protein n=1 Tax=Lysinibacillus sphaericus TaxID=1421 RepID=UPI0018CE4E2C|nr:Bax inhibitor-1 family protein [Lysinibacillus sphaericus]MBG9693247.1 hypothetical protein [Lysinibacillus sphaericus]
MGAAKSINSSRLDKANISENHKKVLKHFSFMWVLTGAGIYVGTLVPPIVALIAGILAILILILAVFAEGLRRNPITYHSVPFLLGIGLWFTTTFYIDKMGAGTVLSIFIGTVVLFILLGVIGHFMRDISGWGKYLFFALIGLILFSVLGAFIASNLFATIMAGLGIVLFSLYTIYDFNEMAYYPISDEEAPAVALGLYLDFINLFLDILRFVWGLISSDLFD